MAKRHAGTFRPPLPQGTVRPRLHQRRGAAAAEAAADLHDARGDHRLFQPGGSGQTRAVVSAPPRGGWGDRRRRIDKEEEEKGCIMNKHSEKDNEEDEEEEEEEEDMSR